MLKATAVVITPMMFLSGLVFFVLTILSDSDMIEQTCKKQTNTSYQQCKLELTK